MGAASNSASTATSSATRTLVYKMTNGRRKEVEDDPLDLLLRSERARQYIGVNDRRRYAEVSAAASWYRTWTWVWGVAFSLTWWFS